MSLRLEIDHLLVDGLDADGAEVFAAALEGELARRLAAARIGSAAAPPAAAEIERHLGAAVDAALQVTAHGAPAEPPRGTHRG